MLTYWLRSLLNDLAARLLAQRLLPISYPETVANLGFGVHDKGLAFVILSDDKEKLSLLEDALLAQFSESSVSTYLLDATCADTAQEHFVDSIFKCLQIFLANSDRLAVFCRCLSENKAVLDLLRIFGRLSDLLRLIECQCNAWDFSSSDMSFDQYNQLLVFLTSTTRRFHASSTAASGCLLFPTAADQNARVSRWFSLLAGARDRDYASPHVEVLLASFCRSHPALPKLDPLSFDGLSFAVPYAIEQACRACELGALSPEILSSIFDVLMDSPMSFALVPVFDWLCEQLAEGGWSSRPWRLVQDF